MMKSAIVASALTLAVFAGLSPLLASSDEDNDGILDAQEEFLLQKHAPVVLLFPGEQRLPANVDWYLNRTRLRFHHATCSDDPIQYYPDQWELTHWIWPKKHSIWWFWNPCSADGHTERSWRDYENNQAFFLQVVNDSNHDGSTNAANWKVYGHVYPNYFGGMNVQYWFFYPYSDLLGLAKHEADWENITVQLDSYGDPVDVIYYSHGGGHKKNWSDVHKFAQDHPVVIAAEGSHASYRDVDDCAWYDSCASIFPVELSPDAWYTWTGGKPSGAPGYQGAGVVNVGERNPGSELDSLNGQRFIYFSGHWGEIGADPGAFCPVLPTACVAGLLWPRKDFSGPRGPAYQDAWNHNRLPKPNNDIVFVDDDFDVTTPGWGFDRFDTIYEGVFNVGEGGTVNVAAGTYYEKFEINKRVRLIGVEGRDVTFIDAQGQTGSPIIDIRSDEVWISGFTIQNASVGIHIFASTGCTITENTLRNFTWGLVYSLESENNQVYFNNFENNSYVPIASLAGGSNVYCHSLKDEDGDQLGDWPGGNYFDDYTGTDADGDGLGDTPYPIWGSDELDVDPLPLMERDGWERLMNPPASYVELTGAPVIEPPGYGPLYLLATCPIGDVENTMVLEVHLFTAENLPVEGYSANLLTFDVSPTDGTTQFAAPLEMTFTPIPESHRDPEVFSDTAGIIRFEVAASTSIVGPIDIEVSLGSGAPVGQVSLIANSPDSNGDGHVNLADLGEVSIALNSGTHPWQFDFNGDGVVNIIDVSFFAMHNAHNQ